MSVTNRPWFYAESLRAQFSQDVTEALVAGHIDAPLARWLQSLSNADQPETGLPRVDRLIREDGVLIGAELAGALLITDPAGAITEAFLHTPLSGLERFASRQQLLTQLVARVAHEGDASNQLEYQRIEGDVFESSMLSIIDQQVQHLQQLTEGLSGLPSLRDALGETLLQNINSQLPDVTPDVLTHLALIKASGNSAAERSILGSQSLIELAINSFANTPLPDGVCQQLLDRQGRELDTDQALPWEQALAGVKSGLLGVYEKLLADYWDIQRDTGVSYRDLTREGFTERFRQHLLEHRQQGLLTSSEFAALKSVCMQGDGWADQIRISRLSMAIAGQEPVKLAGIFLIERIDEQSPALFVYSARLGLQRFSSVTAVTAYFSGIDGRTLMFSYSSRNDYPLLRVPGTSDLHLDPVDSAPLLSVVESVIGLQKRDLNHVLTQVFTSPAEAAVTVIDAMDIRSLIDARLSIAGQPDRWNEAMAQSEQDWRALTSPARNAELAVHFDKNSDAQATLPWAVWLRDARARIDEVFQGRPGVVDCACSLLNRYLAVLHSEPIDAQRMWFHDEKGDGVSLAVLLLERVTGYRSAGAAEGYAVYVDPLDSMYPQAVSWLTPQVLEKVLVLVQRAFVEQYSNLIRAFRAPQLRVGVSSVIPANAFSLIREGLHRLELNVHRNKSKVSALGLSMLQQVLDRPVFSLRESLGAGATEIYLPTLSYDNNQPEVTLTNAMVLHQPLNSACKPLLWSAVQGLHEFDSLDRLRLDLEARLTFRGSRDRWLSLLSHADQDKFRASFKRDDTRRVAIGLSRINEHFLERMQSDELQRQCAGIDAAYQTNLVWQADAGLLERKLAVVERDDMARTALDRVSIQIEQALLSRNLPDWLEGGSTEDLITFCQLLVRFARLYNSMRPILQLFSQPAYAAAELRQALQQDFPGLLLNPDRITVTLTRYTAAPGGLGQIPSSIAAATTEISESLTGYAINRFSRIHDAILSVSSGDATALPGSLNATYIRELVRRLDIGAGYERYLNQVFSKTAPGYADRLDQFMAQAPCAIRLVAFEQKIRGSLTRTGYDFVENVISMPDGLARLPVNGQTVTFSPFKLIAAEGYSADVVEGIFLIAPANQAKGPWILHAVAAAEFLFKEYPGKDELLIDLYTSTTLQALILERLDPKVRFVYEQGGFMTPHLSWATGGYMELSPTLPGPVQLSIEPIQENVLSCLFRATQQVMLILARTTSVTTAEDDRASTHMLLLLGVEQVLMFLPGRAGALVSLWQAQDLLNASWGAASQEQWGRATAEFIAALALLISSRQQSDEDITENQTGLSLTDDSVTPRWHDQHLQLDSSDRLQSFEAVNVSLSNLQYDQALNIYKDPVTLSQYAAISGKVYQVRRGTQGWNVFKGADAGPGITLGGERRWVLDTALGNRRDGGALTRLRSATLEMDIDDILLVEARGIPEIQRLYPHKAREIVDAHDRARFYLENALNNLIVPGPQRELDPRTVRIITDFFGVKSLTNVAVSPIKKALLAAYNLLLDPLFSPHTSERYVVGTNKLGYEDSTAFNFQNDPMHRIFLTERYFNAPYVRLKTMHLRQSGFDAGTHFRASILIHELSHMASGTYDIAYVDSSMPFIDLLEDAGNYRARLKLECQQAQQSLSHMTPREKLFRLEEGEVARDLKVADGEAKGIILKLTGTASLEDARDKFFYDPKIRAQVILSNADSVALLATLLGRERF